MAYEKQTWDTDTTSYVNPTRMNHIEDGIANADLTNKGYTLPISTGVLALASDITFRKLSSGFWNWNTQASYSIDAYSGGTIIVYGGRSGKGFMAICPNNNNEVYEIANNTGCTISQTYDSDTGKHTITFSNRTSYVGSNIFVNVIG